jgi:hypothetical protein
MTKLLAATVLAAGLTGPHPDRDRGCHKTFTVRMDTRAARAIYRGTRPVSGAQTRLLERLERCQRPVDRPRAHRAHAYNVARRREWAQRRLDAQLIPAIASWYDTEGVGACGYGTVQSGYRFASLFLACGTRIVICHYGCVVATMSDHGPYIAGRTFDLNVNVRDAIGCGGICLVRWRRA